MVILMALQKPRRKSGEAASGSVAPAGNYCPSTTAGESNLFKFLVKEIASPSHIKIKPLIQIGDAQVVCSDRVLNIAGGTCSQPGGSQRSIASTIGTRIAINHPGALPAIRVTQTGRL